MSQVGWTPIPLVTAPPVVDSNTTYTIQTAPNGDTLLIGSDGSSAVIATPHTTDTYATLSGTVITFADGSTIDVAPSADICETPTRTPDVASMKLLYCDASGIGAIDYLDFITLDSDDDSLTDIAEVVTHNTNPLNPDTDGGGVDDGTEVAADADPLDAADDICQLMKASANLVLVSSSAGNTGPDYYAWSAPEGLATDALNASANNTGQVLYGIPVATAGCAATDPDFEAINASAGNSSPTHYLLKA